MKTGPILIFEDDKDDCELLIECFQRIPVTNKILCFDNGKEAFDYLKTTTEEPFFILSDINIPLMNGLELKKAINDTPFLHNKTIPFIFLTTSSDRNQVNKAHKLNVQGYFVKPSDVVETATLVKEITAYWRSCKLPTNIN